jgi:putative hydrolase of HD superfamily
MGERLDSRPERRKPLRELAGLLIEAATLKKVPRMGWAMRGVSDVESVAEHSFGVAFVSLALADAMRSDDGAEIQLDLEKVMVTALLHDLGEVRLTDLPSSAQKLIPDSVKRQAEASAIQGLLAALPSRERWRTFWREFEEDSSPEGRLVRDADKLEMMIQCLRYEMAGSSGLDDYWQAQDKRVWFYPFCASLYAELKALRP